MLISNFVEGVRSDIENLGRLGGGEFEQFAGRLADAVGPVLRSRLLEALDLIVAESNLADDGTNLGLGLAGDEVTLVQRAPDVPMHDPIGDLNARFALRLPEDLKERVDQMAQKAGASTNSWIVRALTQEATEHAMRSAKQAGRQLRGTGRS